MNEVLTDDQVAELFASANPAPRADASPDDREPTAPREPSDTVIMFDEPRGTQPGNNGSRPGWWLLGAAAAVIALVAGVALVASRDDADEDPAILDETGTTTATTLPSAVDPAAIDTVEAFLGAIEAGDSAAARALVSDDAPIFVAKLDPAAVIAGDVDLAGQVAWLQAWGVRRQELTCDAGPREASTRSESIEVDGDTWVDLSFDQTVDCSFTLTNRLGDLNERSQFNQASFRLLDGTIVYADAGLGDLAWAGFRPYMEWAETEHPDRWAEVWNDEGPLTTVESARIEDHLITSYMAEHAPDPNVRAAYGFVAALNIHDAGSARELLSPEATVRVMNTGPGGSSVEDQFAWLAAFDWTWSAPFCSSWSDGNAGCIFRERNRLLDAVGIDGAAGVTLTIGDDGIERASWTSQFATGPTINRFETWANATDPDAARVIFGEGDGGLTEAAVQTLDEQLTAFLASDALSAPDTFSGDAHVTEFVDAVNARDLDALTAVIEPGAASFVGWDNGWDDHLRWLTAVSEQWQLRENDCEPVSESVAGCWITSENALTDHAGVERPLFATVEMQGDDVARITVFDQSEGFDGALGDFVNWLQSEHTDDFAQLWQTTADGHVPILTPAAVELHAQYIAEYTGSEG